MVHRSNGGVKIINGILQNINPATGERIYPSIAITTPSELSTVVSKAKIAQCVWGNFPLSKRVELLRQSITTGIIPMASQLATTITNEMGKALSESQLEVQAAIDMRGEWLDMVREANEDVVLVEADDNKETDADANDAVVDEAAESVIVRDPLGVVAVLSPWNVSTIFFAWTLDN
jgi:acyl-CoA reductase-like NAD-dependent aldehyde dehydrogenase